MWTHIRKDRRAKAWLGALASTALLGFVVFSHIWSPFAGSSLIDSFQDSLHGPGFAFVTILIVTLLRTSRQGAVDYRLAGLLAISIGVLSEAVQVFFPRDASIGDLIADCLGVIAGLGIMALLDPSVRQRLRRPNLLVAGIVTIVAIALTFVPTLFYGYAAISQLHAKPKLLTFDSIWERAIYRQTLMKWPERLSPPHSWPEHHKLSALATEAGRFRILIRIETFLDWTPYRSLNFFASSATQDSVKVQLVIRQRPDAISGERSVLRKTLEIDTTYRHFKIPIADIMNDAKNGPMDMARIASIALLAIGDEPNASVWLDDFYLE